jgi:hypothetical protein
MTDYERGYFQGKADSIKLMQQSLDALEYASDQTKPKNLHGCDCLICTTILALSEKLKEQK